jgi:hypothetical protein
MKLFEVLEIGIAHPSPPTTLFESSGQHCCHEGALAESCFVAVSRIPTEIEESGARLIAILALREIGHVSRQSPGNDEHCVESHGVAVAHVTGQ